MEMIKLIVLDSLVYDDKEKWEHEDLHDLQLDSLISINNQGEIIQLTYI